MNELGRRMQISNVKSRLCNFYERTFPEFQNVEINNIVDITSGWENDLLSFNLRYHDQGERIKKELVVRIYPATDSKEKSEKEFSVMKNLWDLSYPVPKMEILESSGEIIGKPFVIMERINGPTLGEVLRKSSLRTQTKLMECFIDLYLQLHKLNWKEFQLIFPLPGSQSFHTHVKAQLNEYYTSLLKHGMSDFREVFEWLRNRIDKISISSLSLIHLDYHPDNILMKKGKNPVVIDWGTSTVLDFRFDLAWTILLTNAHSSPSLGQQVFDLYQAKLGRAIEDFEFFYMFAATRRLTDYAISMTQGAESSGMRPETTTTLKQYNQVYKFVYNILRDHLDVKIGIIEELLSG